MKRVLVSGVSGPIGAALVPSLEQLDIQVVRLVRGSPTDRGQIPWDPLQPILPAAVSGYDAVIHLAGESIVGKWDAEKKKRMRASRVSGTRYLAEALVHTPARPSVFLCASAIGFYGNRGGELLTESSPGGKGFLADVCREWEEASRAASEHGIRTLNLRFGLVLSPKGGALEKMLTPFRWGFGGRIGSGAQWWSWVHVDDIVGAIHHLIDAQTLEGPVNLVAPNPATNYGFTKTLASVLGRPALFPVPEKAARWAFGEMADELLLSSQRVDPGKLLATGYTFRFPELRQAFEDLVG